MVPPFFCDRYDVLVMFEIVASSDDWQGAFIPHDAK
jgi:hypothetical protein|tara:strand:+ start:4309 stop:4416 length:108 start_codon:yes stop_codon:yes gene_type:complete